MLRFLEQVLKCKPDKETNAKTLKIEYVDKRSKEKEERSLTFKRCNLSVLDIGPSNGFFIVRRFKGN